MNRTLRLLTLALALSLGAAATGCATFKMRPVHGFVELEDQEEYDYRSANADGVVIAVRAMPNRPAGGLAFWTAAIDTRLRREGYVARQAVPVRTDQGLHGRQIRYERVEQGVTYHYWMTVFVKPGGFLSKSRVFTIEAGGDDQTFPPAIPAVERTIHAFRA